MENDPDIVAMIGCSAALTLSGIPFFGPVAAARVGYANGQYVLNPTMAAAADPITSERMRIIGVLRQKGQSRTNPELSERLLQKIVNAPDQFTDFTRPALHRRAWIG